MPKELEKEVIRVFQLLLRLLLVIKATAKKEEGLVVLLFFLFFSSASCSSLVACRAALTADRHWCQAVFSSSVRDDERRELGHPNDSLASCDSSQPAQMTKVSRQNVHREQRMGRL
jgi:hypothetical protein